MTFGFACKNTLGVTQIDEHYRNMVLVSKTTATLQAAATSNIAGIACILVQYPNSVGVARPSPTAIVAVRNRTPFSLSRRNYFRVLTGATEFRVYSCSLYAEVVDIFVFDLIQGASGTDYGMQIFAANGTDIVFDSGYKPLRVCGFICNFTNISNNVVIPAKAGRKVAFSPMSAYREVMASQEILPPQTPRLWATASKIPLYSILADTGSGEDYMYTGDVPYHIVTTATTSSIVQTTACMFIDVTNY